MADETPDLNAVELATELTIAWLGNPNTRSSAEDVPAFLGKMHDTVSALLGTSTPVETAPEAEHTPAVTARKSLASKDHIISMIDGKPYKTLRRHLATHGLTPADRLTSTVASLIRKGVSAPAQSVLALWTAASSLSATISSPRAPAPIRATGAPSARRVRREASAVIISAVAS